MADKEEIKATERKLLNIVEQGRSSASEELETLFEERKKEINKVMIGQAIHSLCHNYKTFPRVYSDMLSYLLRKSGDPNFRMQGSGTTPLMVCANKGCVELVETLINHEKLRIDQTDSKGRTALFYAVDSDNGENLNIVYPLIHNKSANVNLADSSGKTPLIIAVERGSFEMVKLLVESGADVRVKTSSGEDLTELAAKRNHGQIKDYLESLPGMEDKCSVEAAKSDKSYISNLGSIDIENKNPLGQSFAPQSGIRHPPQGRPILHPSHPRNGKQAVEAVNSGPIVNPNVLVGPGMQDPRMRHSNNQMMEILDFAGPQMEMRPEGPHALLSGSQMPGYNPQFFMQQHHPSMKHPYGRSHKPDPVQIPGMGIPVSNMPQGGPRLE